MRPGANHDVRVAVVVGAALVAVVVAVAIVGVLLVRGATSSGADESGAATAQCEGATWQVDLTTVGGSVVAHVSIFDPERRTWTITWDQDEEPTEVTVAKSDIAVGFASAVLGDTDDGSGRTVVARPSGADDSCQLDAALP